MSATFVWALYRVSDEQARAITPALRDSQRASAASALTRTALETWRSGADVLADHAKRHTSEAFARAFHEPWPPVHRRADGKVVRGAQGPVTSAILGGWAGFEPDEGNAHVVVTSAFPALALLAYALGAKEFEKLPFSLWGFTVAADEVAAVEATLATVDMGSPGIRSRAAIWADTYNASHATVGEILSALPAGLALARREGKALVTASVGS